MGTVLIGPDSLEIDAVVPQCLDNQFVSTAVFSEMVSRGVDYRDQWVAQHRERDFRTEFIRSLIYSSQVVIQRAYFKNSDFLYRNYMPENGEQLAAFAHLMREKAIVPFLLRESSLTDELEFDLNDIGDVATNSLLGEVGTDSTCVRLAVDAAANADAADRMVTTFGAGLLRLQVMSDDQRNAMASELFTDPGRLQEEGGWQAFDDAIDRLASYSFRRAGELRKQGRSLTRNDVYKDNFVAAADPEDNVAYGRFRVPSPDEPFLFELKKYVDLVYNVNLPDRLKRFTFTPVGMPSRMALQEPAGEGYSHHQLSELVSDSDALESVRRTFMAHAQKAMSLPLLSDLTVADVVEIRALPQWEPFKDAQALILKYPLDCLDRLERFHRAFDEFQWALSQWYNRKYQRPRTEERYCSFVSLALSVAGKLIVAGSDLGGPEKALSVFASDRVVSTIPARVKGYAAKLMVGVYDIGARRLDADRTYTVELMQTNAELMREDVAALLDSIDRDGSHLPNADGQIADQGIQ